MTAIADRSQTWIQLLRLTALVNQQLHDTSHTNFECQRTVPHKLDYIDHKFATQISDLPLFEMHYRLQLVVDAVAIALISASDRGVIVAKASEWRIEFHISTSQNLFRKPEFRSVPPLNLDNFHHRSAS